MTPLPLGPVGGISGGDLNHPGAEGRNHPRPEPLWCWDLSSENRNHGELRNLPFHRSLYQLISLNVLMFPISHTQVEAELNDSLIQGHCS